MESRCQDQEGLKRWLIRRTVNRIRFTGKILPPYLRRTKSLDELVPWLYLKGISTGDFGEVLEDLVGPQADGVYFNVRLESVENRRQCFLVLMGATAEGKKS